MHLFYTLLVTVCLGNDCYIRNFPGYSSSKTCNYAAKVYKLATAKADAKAKVTTQCLPEDDKGLIK